MEYRFYQRLMPLLAVMLLSWATGIRLSWAQEFDIQRDYIGLTFQSSGDPRAPIVESALFLGLHLQGSRSPYFPQRISGFKRAVELDSTGRFIQLTETIDGIPFRLPAVLTREDYLQERADLELTRLWRNTAAKNVSESGYSQRGGSQGIRIDIPVEIKSKTFQKIFGSGTVGLDVSGDISISGGFRHEKHSEVKTAFNRGSDYNFKMEQTQRFRVQGRIGDKVTIGIDQDSERAFDFENNIELKYEGYEDEIIQSIEAGNISLNLPGTQFVTFGGKSSGLFGIKTEARIGNLSLTAITSQEKGEKKRLSLTGGASEAGERREDYQYRKNTYYFVDQFYRNQYLQRDQSGNFLIDPNRIIKKLEVYVSRPGLTNEADVVRGWAIVPPNPDALQWQIAAGDTAKADRNHYVGYFKRLEKSDYYIDNELGFIRLRSPLQQEVLAIAYRDSTGRTRGDINYDNTTARTITLRLLKTETPLDTDQTWDLEWKNVYYLGSRDIPEDGFDLRIYYKPPSGDPQETTTIDGKAYTFLQIFGLDRVNESGEPIPDNKIDMNPNILNLANGELFFPDIQPFDPLSAEYQKLLAPEYRVPAIYDTTATNVITGQSNFYIEIKSRNRSSEYRLGMNIIENSEDVRLNGRQLTRGVDYTIDYFTGTLRLLNEQATLPSANLDVTYESNQLFQIDKKTVIGARAEYDLWDESFLGATFMYLNETTLDQKVRVGRGPMRNMVWDVNTSLSVKPFFLTRVANWLPFVDTREESSIKFEGEVAQVLPNPNTKNNPLTNENDGVAYIDDFEASKQFTPFSIVQQSWEYCAPPMKANLFNPDSPTLEKRARLVYYNPYEQYLIKQIKPNQDVNANVAQTTNILVFKITPPDSIPDVTEGWSGIQMALSSGYWNQSEAKFLEIWVKGDSGVIHINLGEITEDIIPNKKLDSEDRMKNGIRNGILDVEEGEDTGMDGMSGKDPFDFWDLNGDGIRNWGEPISWDDWSYNSNVRPINYDRVNGTEGNANDYGGLRYPDTEDLNGNGQLDQNNDYFEYSFSLDKNSADADRYLVGGLGLPPDQDFGWRQYRIPLDEFTDKVGNPTLSLIKYVRIWMSGFTSAQEHTIQIAYIDLVSSEWKEIGVAGEAAPEQYELTEEPPVTVTVINTHDNPEYIPPPGVIGEEDRITGVIAKEQSLVMQVENLLPGENGAIQKTFYEAQDYIHYENLKMYVYGADLFGSHIHTDSSRIEVFLRFGSDERNYYEVRRPVYPGWLNNDIDVDLVELAALKLKADPDSTIDGRYGWSQVLQDGQILFIKGQPALTNIRTLIVGVKNLSAEDLGVPLNEVSPFKGQIWINELRLSNIKKDTGMAMRARLDFQWADLIRFNGEVDKRDADFHNVAERFGDGDNQLSGNFSTTLYLDKFFPRKLGISLPINYNYAVSEATPKYKPGTDVETEALPDSIIDVVQKYNEKKGVSVSLSVTSRSQKFVVKNLLSQLKMSYSRSESYSHNSTTQYANGLQENAKVDWGINFSRDNYFKPFKWLGDSGRLRKLTDLKLYYTPQSITTSHNGIRNNQESLTRTEVFSANSTFSVNRNYSTRIKIFENLSLDMSRNYIHDLRGLPSDTLWAQIKQGQLGLLTGIDQNSSLKYSPQIFSWLTNNFNYSAGFKYGFNRQQTLAAANASQNRTLSFNGSLNLKNLVRSIYDPDKNKPGARGGRPGGRPRPGQPQASTSDEKKPEEKGGPNLALQGLGYFVKFFSIFDPFTLNWSDRNNITAYGVMGIPAWGFQFGLTDSLGVPLELSSGSGSLNRGSSSKNRSFNTSSGFNIGRDIDVDIKYDQSYSLNTSTQTTGSRSQAWLTFGDDIDMLFPNWSVRIGGGERLPLLKNWFSRVSLDHAYNGQNSETFDMENGQETPTKTNSKSGFRPLIGVTMQMKNGLSLQARYNKQEDESVSLGSNFGATRSEDDDLSLTANWSKQSDFRIPIWPFNTMRLKNSINFSFTFAMTGQQQFKSRAGGDYEPTSETSKWSLKPAVQYSFSDKVRGGASFEMGKTHNALVGDSSFKEFSVDVKIAIHGN